LHVFTYSARPGTPAADTADQVPMEVRKHRTHVLRNLAQRKNLEFRKSMLGRTISVVTIADGALSDNYLKVSLARPREANRIEDVLIGCLTNDGLCESGTPLHLPPILQ
jgi:threonylcarbamoyladenosine tRNA methylthiotransferase MtaB